MGKQTKENIENMYKQYQQYPRIPVIVTSHADGRDNAMGVSWHMPMASNPPYYAVSIAAKRFTYSLIVKSEEFGVNFMPLEKARLIAFVGRTSGFEVDKFKQFAILKDKSISTSAPVLMDAYAAYECQLVDDRDYGDHHLLVGKIVTLHWNDDYFTADELLDLNKLNPTMYLGQNRYITVKKEPTLLLDKQELGLE